MRYREPQRVIHELPWGGGPSRKVILRPFVAYAALLLTCSGCSGSADVEFMRKFQEAQTIFDQAQSPDDYLRSASLYQEILDARIESGALLYNQGNAFMRAGERGRAVACYRQAKRYRPRDPYLDANLKSALRSEEVKLRSSVLAQLLFWQDWISYPGKFQITLALGMVTFLFGIAALALPAWPWLARTAWTLLLVTLVMAASAGYDWYRFDMTEHGVVVADEALARKGDSDRYELAFTKPLPETTEFCVVERRSGWILARLAGNEEGWLKREDVVVY